MTTMLQKLTYNFSFLTLIMRLLMRIKESLKS